MIMTGTAGTGKSRTIRAFVEGRRQAVMGTGVSLKQKREVCLLAAPTGCASFQLRHGACTVHSAFAVRPGFFGVTSNRESAYFLEKVRRWKAASLFVLDEFSMIGRQMMGKMCFRLREGLGVERSFGGKDVVLGGDPKQIPPIGDEPVYKEGRYQGKGLNKPRNGQAPEGTPSVQALTERGDLFKNEFEDVVILREVHRIERDAGVADAAAAAAYQQDADRFLQVTAGMADCTWTREDHAWLSRRNRSFLARAASGRLE